MVAGVRRSLASLARAMVIVAGMLIVGSLFNQLDLDLTREILIFSFLAALAHAFAVPLPRGWLSAELAVIIAVFLAYHRAATVYVQALAILGGYGLLGRVWPLSTLAYNVSQGAVVAALSTTAYEIAKDFVPGMGWAYVAFCLVYFLANHLLIFLYYTGSTDCYPLFSWQDVLRYDLLAYLFAVPCGLLMHVALTGLGVGWAVVFFLPLLFVQLLLRRYVKLEMANRELRALFNLARILQKEGLEPPEIGTALLREVRLLVPFTAALFLLNSYGNRFYRTVAAAGHRSNYWLEYEIDTEEKGWKEVISNKFVIVPDTRRSRPWQQEPGLPQVYRSLLLVPVVCNGEVPALLILGAKRPGTFNEQHAAVCSLLSAQIAPALLATTRLKEEW